MMRTAISPRFATRTLANIIPLDARWLDELRCDCRLRLFRPRGCYKRRSATVNDEQRLAKVHRLPVDDHLRDERAIKWTAHVVAQAKRLDMPAITGVALDELERRVAAGLTHDLPVPFYRMRNRRFSRVLL